MVFLMEQTQIKIKGGALRDCPKALYCIEYLYRRFKFGRTFIKVTAFPSYPFAVLSLHRVLVHPKTFQNEKALAETLTDIIERQNPYIEVTQVKKVKEDV